MYRREEFRDWFGRTGKKPTTVAAHISTLNSVDRAFGLDEKLEGLGTDKFLGWTKAENSGPFEKYPSHTRSALNRYIEFHIASQAPEEVPQDDEADELVEPLLFQLEREMQVAVRKQIGELEDGITIADNGHETAVATGKIDIVARGQDGKLVVIELKAGKCPSSALEQALGYADALAEERGEEVRAYLIAGTFSDRTRAAARRTKDLEIRTYEFSVKFNKITETGA